jgi:biopolymer transport protein ExbB
VGQINIIDVFFGSFTLWILLACSVLALAVTLERWWYFRRSKFSPKKFLELLGKIQTLLLQGKGDEAVQATHGLYGPVPDLIRTAIINRNRSKMELDELLTAARMEQRMILERYLVVLGTLGNICPFIGLFGTVVGIIKAFHDLAVSGSGGPAVVAAGISEALVATAGGLVVAIPAVVVFNYFMKKVKETSTNMEVSSIRLMVVIHGSK